MFRHAEEFDSRDAARARYLQITGRLRADRDQDLGCYNLLYEGKRPVVAIMAAEAPPADVLAGLSGRPVELPQEFWDTLALRHRPRPYGAAGTGGATKPPRQASRMNAQWRLRT